MGVILLSKKLVFFIAKDFYVYNWIVVKSKNSSFDVGELESSVRRALTRGLGFRPDFVAMEFLCESLCFVACYSNLVKGQDVPYLFNKDEGVLVINDGLPVSRKEGRGSEVRREAINYCSRGGEMDFV